MDIEFLDIYSRYSTYISIAFSRLYPSHILSIFLFLSPTIPIPCFYSKSIQSFISSYLLYIFLSSDIIGFAGRYKGSAADTSISFGEWQTQWKLFRVKSPDERYERSCPLIRMNLHKYGGEKDKDSNSNINEEGYEEDVLRFKVGFSSYVDNGLTLQSPYEEYADCTTVSP